MTSGYCDPDRLGVRAVVFGLFRFFYSVASLSSSVYLVPFLKQGVALTGRTVLARRAVSAARPPTRPSPCQISRRSIKPLLRYGDLSVLQNGGRPPSWICYMRIGTTHENYLMVFVVI